MCLPRASSSRPRVRCWCCSFPVRILARGFFLRARSRDPPIFARGGCDSDFCPFPKGQQHYFGSRILTKKVSFSLHSPQVQSARVALKTQQRGTQIIAMAKPERGSKPSAEVIAANPNATVDGKLWVCQGCGYVYDGTKGPWAEDKRCPACGERRFALKSRDEMAVAIGGLIVSVLLISLLFVIVKL